MGETPRSIISIFLFIHIFVLTVCLSTSMASSALQQRLLALFRPYTQLLNFELAGTRWYLTHALAGDVDHRIEVLPGDGDAASAADWRPLHRGRRGGERLRRYQRLAEVMAVWQEDEETTALLSEAIARNFWETDNQTVEQIRCRQHTLQSREAIDSTVPDERDPNSAIYFVTVYRADVLTTAADQIRILKRTKASLEAAPIRNNDGSVHSASVSAGDNNAGMEPAKVP